MDLMRPQQDDHEAAMARADLFKCAQYSFKLFKMIHDGQQLEGWVQAKITKAADYIASVYHYMEYEMKFSEYGEQIENSDMYSESQKQAIRNMLTEAKATMKKLTAAQAAKAKKEAKKTEESLDPIKAVKKTDEGIADVAKKVGGAVKSVGKKALDKLGHGSDEDLIKDLQKKVGVPQTGKAPSKVKEAKKAKKDYDGDGKVESPKDEVWGSRAKAAAKAGKPFKEAAKPDFLDLDKDGNKKEPMKKAAKSKKVEEGSKCNHTPKGEKCPVHGLKECGMYEGSTGDYSAKKAAAGKDIGKPGKNFAKIAAKAEKGGAKSGAAVAGAVLKKLRAKG